MKHLVIAAAALGLSVTGAMAEGCGYGKTDVTAQAPIQTPMPTTVAESAQSLPVDQKVAEAPAPTPIKTN